jgi:hypothetical protein
MVVRAGLARKTLSERYFVGEKAVQHSIYCRLMYTVAVRSVRDLDLGHWADLAAGEVERKHSCSPGVGIQLRG